MRKKHINCTRIRSEERELFHAMIIVVTEAGTCRNPHWMLTQWLPKSDRERAHSTALGSPPSTSQQPFTTKRTLIFSPVGPTWNWSRENSRTVQRSSQFHSCSNYPNPIIQLQKEQIGEWGNAIFKLFPTVPNCPQPSPCVYWNKNTVTVENTRRISTRTIFGITFQISPLWNWSIKWIRITMDLNQKPKQAQDL